MAEVQISARAEEFFAKVATLAAFDFESYEFHCEQCQTVLLSIQADADHFTVLQEKAKAEGVAVSGDFTKKKLDFARDLIMKRGCAASKRRVGGTRHGQDPNRVVDVQCVHKDITTEFRHELNADGSPKRTYIKAKNNKNKVFTVFVECENRVTGTALEVGGWNNRCEEHRS